MHPGNQSRPAPRDEKSLRRRPYFLLESNGGNRVQAGWQPDQTWNELPQPHDLTTFGLLKTKPRFSSPS